MNTTIGEWLKKPSTSSYYDKEYILQYVLNKKRNEVYLLWEESLSEAQLHKCSDILSRYEKGEPLAYILGETEFYGYKFATDQEVFIPRPETEILVETILNYYKNSPPRFFIDFGCGSGSIGLSLLKNWPDSQLLAIDKNEKAVDLTLKNARNFKLDSQLEVSHQDVVNLQVKNSVSLIVGNPPYIAKGDSYVDPIVLKYEPEEALFSKSAGMSDIQMWLDKACLVLSNRGGHYFFEIGYNQCDKVKKILKNQHLVESFTPYRDYQGYNRVIHCSIRKK